MTQTENVVGDRVLVAVQAINISRLSTHPVPTVPGTLIVVAGAGPKDSNGAGKSSFIAAITALLGDEQWRFASGAKAVSELLFNAELAAHGDQQWASADHGYIIGVFDVPSAGLPMTVWLRVNREAPYLEIRWTESVRLAAGASEADRVTRSDEVWTQLPRSAGRRDVVARDLTRVLYGDRVRCVSFLSTSVRSKVATNLLSQPLNEISPERIFEAIAALTGLDAELDQEREARRDEHAKRVRAAEASDRLREFESESESLLAAFDRRDQARVQLASALRCWRGRLARRFADAADRDERLDAELAVSRDAAEAASDAIAALREEIATLKDDSLDRALASARRELAQIQARAAKLEADRAVAQSTADGLRSQMPALEELRRQADGRDVAAAERETAAARRRVDEALKSLGVADREAETARAALDDAENGPAAAQLAALAGRGVAAASLLDAIDAAEQARDASTGGPAAGLLASRTWPHEHAVIVDGADLAAAAHALAELPGSVLVSSTGVTVVGAFESAVTGREARVKAAEQRLHRARDAQDRASAAVRQAEAEMDESARRAEGARAAVRLDDVRDRLSTQRELLAGLHAAAGELAPTLDAAEESVSALDFRARTRDMEIERLEGRRARFEADRARAREQADRTAAERQALDIEGLTAEWGSPVEEARDWLAAEESLTADEWWRGAERHLDAALRGGFGDSAETGDEMPEELAFLVKERRGGRTAEELATFPAVCAALGSYLRGQEEYERHRRRQIETQLSSRRRDLETATRGAEDAAQSTAVHRAALTEAIRARLARVAEEFEKLDVGYGGYGATLDFPVPAAPADPEQRWSWRVVPKWRRGDGQGFVPYNRRANTALMDEKAVKLVCAAAIASSGGGHLTLVLDELGRNLGKEHRREAVALFRRIGEMHGITVIGALQDDMEPYAIDACGQYVKLRRSSDAMPYNEPPIIVGHDRHAERVRMLADWVTRPRAAS
ncbi:chromosome partitioning protein ParA [Microtetraspora sp. AC03309]|uniref:chromosome partitioning protein ParA n=1 Tax=Microtetraspora sp. AC03309 TaxID=2779376 RepID=UPI001E4E4666|nr:chromosome partitioning protein ParA [Microtetraspora sp. AC03309]MCC5581291.1 chromosome partitioning protein ParA [Microtetraspora sp. AC03309]